MDVNIVNFLPHLKIYECSFEILTFYFNDCIENFFEEKLVCFCQLQICRLQMCNEKLTWLTSKVMTIMLKISFFSLIFIWPIATQINRLLNVNSVLLAIYGYITRHVYLRPSWQNRFSGWYCNAHLWWTSVFTKLLGGLWFCQSLKYLFYFIT